MMKASSRPTDAAAMHEAGHAVAGTLLDRPFVYVSLREKRAHCVQGGHPAVLVYREGVVGSPEALEAAGRNRRAGRLDEADAICRMAGIAAEAAIGTPLEQARFGGSMDFAYIVETVRNGGGTETEGRERAVAAFKAAMDLIKGHWTAVNAVADQLLYRCRLKYGEVKAIVDGTVERPTEPSPAEASG